MGTPLKVLILEDRASDAELSVRELRKAGFDVDWRRVETGPDFLAALEPSLDVILLDFNLPAYSGVAGLVEVQARGLDVPCIVVTGAITDEQAVATLKGGATDYILKDRLARLAPAVKLAIEARGRRAADQRTQEALHSAEGRLTTLVQHMPDAVWALDPEAGRLTYVSPVIEQLTGRSAEEFLAGGTLWLDAVHPDDRKIVTGDIDKTLKGGSPTSDFRIIHRDGSIRHLQTHMWRTTNSADGRMAVEGVASDRNAHYTAEAERRRAEALEFQRKAAQESYRQLLETPGRIMPDAYGAQPLSVAEAVTMADRAEHSPALDRKGWALLWAAAGVTVLLILLPMATIPDAAVVTISNVVQLLAASTAAVACVLRGGQLGAQHRMPWMLIGFACASWAVGQGLWTYNESVAGLDPNPPGLDDIAYLLTPLLLTVALVRLSPVRKLDGRQRLAVIGDALLSVAALLLLLWHLGLSALLEAGTFEDLVAAAYPFTDAVVLAVALGMTLRQKGALKTGLPLLILGISAIAVADLVYAFAIFGDGYATGAASDAGWAAGFLLIAAAAWASPEEKQVPPPRPTMGRAGGGMLLPVIALILVAGSMAYHFSFRHFPTLLDIGLYISTILLAGTRQWLYATEATATLHREQALQGSLKREAARTRAALQAVELAQAVGRMGSWQFDHPANLLTGSPEYRKIIEARADERLTQEGIMARIHPLDRPVFAKTLEESVAGHTALQAEFRLPFSDGRNKWIALSGHHLYGADGRVLQTVGTIQDITERRQAEESMRHANRRFQMATNATQDILWDWTPATGKTWHSEQIEQFGYRQPAFPTDLAGFVALVHPDDAPRFGAESEAFLAGSDQRTSMRYRFRKADGSYAEILDRLIVERDAAGKPILLVGAMADITAASHTQAEVLRQKLTLEAAETLARVGSWDWDFLSDSLRASPEAIRILGLELEWPCSSKDFFAAFWPVVHPEDRERAQAHFQGALGEPLSSGASNEFRLVHKDGTVLALQTTLRVQRGPDGRPVTAIGSVVDVTESKEREAELIRARDAAQSSDRAKTLFLAVMSHEIRTPMTAIVGQSELLSETPLSKEQAEMVRSMDAAGRHLLELINTVLNYAKIQSGGLVLSQIRTDLGQLVKEACDEIAPMASKKGLRVDIVAPLLPAVMTDAPRVREALLNLLTNAVKFTPKGSITITVAAQPRGERVSVAIAVTDTGIGIAPDVLPRLFKPFSQADPSYAREIEGAGLGLATSLSIAKALQGDLSVQSAPGAGSTFTFTFLADPAPAAPPAKPDAQKPVKPTEGETRHQRILLVEDNVANRVVIGKLLARLGIKADFASDGQAAVEAVNRQPYDVVFMDLHMPILDGFAATKKIRATHPKTPRIIALTADAMAEDRQKCLDAGMDGYLAKPVRLEDLERALHAISE